ncbi:hypothetical protein H5410_017934 [Solanum commersonii]|uniref:Uncharacterized protein n=1 Tax=Solanum commersonii TaxID=4109 RepID=A0A9J6A0H5_SOLCO|nr:hypothetical protein H5410_017934 [Solanum commersonii]
MDNARVEVDPIQGFNNGSNGEHVGVSTALPSFMTSYDKLYDKQPLFKDCLLDSTELLQHLPAVVPIPTQVSDGVDEPVIEVQEAVLPANPTRSTRTKQTPTWLKDFVSLNIHSDVKYPVSNYISYSHLSPTYQCYLAATSSVKEPTTYSEADNSQPLHNLCPSGEHSPLNHTGDVNRTRQALCDMLDSEGIEGGSNLGIDDGGGAVGIGNGTVESKRLRHWWRWWWRWWKVGGMSTTP